MAESTIDPKSYIGKTLRFVRGAAVGPILDMRKRKQDSRVYLIVDATAFFNQSVEYAVPFTDVEGIQADTVLIHKGAGDHLRGMVYYPDDYRALD